MYSIVLIAVMTAGTPAPGLGWNRQANGYDSYAYAGCLGNCYGCAGCYGGCGGCNGFLGVRSFFRDLFGGCRGCEGGCYGCMGCFGGPSYYGSGFSNGGMMFDGMTPGYTMGAGIPITMTPGQVPLMQPGPAMPQLMLPTPQTTESGAANYATVVVTLPADAKLFIDGVLSTLDTAVRVFRTPELRPGVKYSYELKIAVDRGGKPQETTKIVDVEAGKTARVHFPEPGAAGSTARIQIAMPANATLYVDDAKWPSPGSATIQTPPLETGKDYEYKLKLERPTDGTPEIITRTVVIQAGSDVKVDFNLAADAVASRDQ